MACLWVLSAAPLLAQGGIRWVAQWPVATGAQDLAVDAEGNFWLAYPGRNEIRKYFAVSNYDSVQVIGGRGVAGEGFSQPEQLCATGRSEVYMLDYGNQRLVLLNANMRVSRVLDLSADPLRTSPGEGQEILLFPKAIAAGPFGELFVLNQDDNRVYKFDPLGRFEQSFGGTGYGEGSLPKADGLVVTPENYLVVIDSTAQQLRVFDNFGTFQYLLQPPVQFSNGTTWGRAWVFWQGDAWSLWVPGQVRVVHTLQSPGYIEDGCSIGDRLYLLAGDVVLLYEAEK